MNFSDHGSVSRDTVIEYGKCMHSAESPPRPSALTHYDQFRSFTKISVYVLYKMNVLEADLSLIEISYNSKKCYLKL